MTSSPRLSDQNRPLVLGYSTSAEEGGPALNVPCRSALGVDGHQHHIRMDRCQSRNLPTTTQSPAKVNRVFHAGAWIAAGLMLVVLARAGFLATVDLRSLIEGRLAAACTGWSPMRRKRQNRRRAFTAHRAETQGQVERLQGAGKP